MTYNININDLRLNLAIIQPTPFCNINCSYCYLPDRTTNHRMSRETLRKTISFLMREPGLLDEGSSLVWHCGEPLAVPISFYHEAFDLLEEMNTGSTPVHVRYTTNGMLINQEWCDLIKRRGHTNVRISLDGPQWLHDSNRVDRAGRGTYERVMRGIELLKGNNIPFGISGVLSRKSLYTVQELWEFFKNIGSKDLNFSIEEQIGEHDSTSLDFQSSYSKVQEFFRTLLELRNREAPDIYIRELDELIHQLPWLRAREELWTCLENMPFSLVTIAWDGSISLFSPELLNTKSLTYGDFIFGNVTQHSIEDILASPKFNKVLNDIHDGVDQCRTSCQYFGVCGGGSPAIKLSANGSFRSTETLNCNLRIKAIIDGITEYLKHNAVR
ncbi:MAG: cyclophane-forming radical SAM/SPASM peptide maturase GrrM/OscB [Pyrinomonadaceae bacterium]